MLLGKVHLEVGVVGKLAAMANLAAIITAVVFGENLANIFASQGEVVGQQILGVMVMGDWVVRREELSMEADTLAQETVGN
ncbi:hypothetical protein C361_02254 [Cryptococcus neoformans Tu259-1]|uniref:Uncharacterized protein n=1 Tax=Cryptococcus neoformans Tu259-1 TaxID=1230072 RepID=A0A854QIU7_CRYNE|nr:hypothetical protein C344_02003 [Cryptococcus neoformans var. grubii AD1-7a]OXG25248.1 hypothetical protein C361_02254 [Cryptococcus neoformans var. grubii Tu259-1]OXG84654.1 hypothetical protein C350_02013 [Cryptococcus neoformans var. grubii MW-RSA36]OXH16100.1 hypothetical protein C370_02086 [Cryptococcus neoformans var. grubii A1-35-8]OXH35917.1 hypothetical protein J005_02028 [Cryptococcus neoformans var. grubii]OXL09826.1 hypothetical protein C348_02213 [Cryptococcus neoformans var. g